MNSFRFGQCKCVYLVACCILFLFTATNSGWAAFSGEETWAPYPPQAPMNADSPVAQDDHRFLLEQALESQINLLDTSALDQVIAGLSSELRAELPEWDVRRIVADGGLGDRFSLLHLITRFARFLVREIVFNSQLLGQLALLAVFCAILRNLTHVFPTHGVAEPAFALSFLALLYIGLQSFRAAVDVAGSTLDTMVDLMHAALPLLTAMIAAAGAVTTATLYHPLFVSMVALVATLVRNVILPLTFLSAVLSILGSLSKDFPMKKMAGLVRQWTITLLGLLFILFFGVLSIRGAIAPVTDSIAIKTAKFLTGTFVPVVGSRMAEALDIVIGGSQLIKSAIGVFGMAAIFVIVAFPALKVFSVLFIFRLVTALIEPLSDERLVDALNSLAGSLTLVLACMLTVGLMFFISITILVSMGNVTTLVR
ncbi:MAG: stage III sporulation protein AE [Limnochordia bacterium]|jgi:stage III sporulation protein AE